MNSYVQRRDGIFSNVRTKSHNSLTFVTPCHLKLFKNNFTVADPGKGPVGYSPSPLFLDQTEARRAEKTFLGDRPPLPHLSKGLDDRSPPPPPLIKVWVRPCFTFKRYFALLQSCNSITGFKYVVKKKAIFCRNIMQKYKPPYSERAILKITWSISKIPNLNVTVFIPQ